MYNNNNYHHAILNDFAYSVQFTPHDYGYMLHLDPLIIHQVIIFNLLHLSIVCNNLIDGIVILDKDKSKCIIYAYFADR